MRNDFTAPFLLIGRDGWTAEYSDSETLYNALRGKIRVYDVHQTRADATAPNVLRSGHYIVRDDLGKMVKHEDIFGRAPCEYNCWYRRKRRKTKPLAYGATVPGTGKRGSYGYFRNLTFFGTHRAQAAALVDDRDADYRPKGKIKDTPSNWDDICRNNERSWKRHRKTQWRPT